MRLYEEQFLWLLRAGLQGRERTDFPMIAPCYIDWSSLLSLAKRQTTLLVVQDGLETLIAAQKARGEELVEIPPRALLKVQNLRMQTLQVHNDLNRLIVEADALLRASGIVSVLLKGESMAALYPHPESRNCGDIDLFVFPEDYPRAAALLSARYDTVSQTTDKHGSFRSGRYNIELHFHPLILQRPWRRRHFERYTRSSLSRPERTVSLPFADGTVCVPPVTYNAIFLLGHIYHHFIEGGIGLRQLCDWTLFVDRHYREIDPVELADGLRRFGLMSAWQIFACLSVRFLGIAPARMPLYDEDRAQEAERVLSIILVEGNFGRYGRGKWAGRKEDSYSRKKSKSFRLVLARLQSRISLFPLDVSLYLLKWMRESLLRVLKRR